MQISASQLQTHHKALIDALKQGETIDITYHGQVLGVVYPKESAPNYKKPAEFDAFFGMHKDLGINSVEDELRSIRKGRKAQLDAV